MGLVSIVIEFNKIIIVGIDSVTTEPRANTASFDSTH